MNYSVGTEVSEILRVTVILGMKMLIIAEFPQELSSHSSVSSLMTWIIHPWLSICVLVKLIIPPFWTSTTISYRDDIVLKRASIYPTASVRSTGPLIFTELSVCWRRHSGLLQQYENYRPLNCPHHRNTGEQKNNAYMLKANLRFHG